MSLFSNMKTEGLEESQDRLGGFQVFDTAIYPAKIKQMYAGKSQGGATSVTVIAELEGGQEYRETIYISNRNGENFYFTPDKKKAPLPGFTTINDICLIASGKELSEQPTEEKVVKVYDFEAKKEVPTNVPVLVECIGKPVALGIVKQLVNKREKVGDEYQETAESKEENAIDKVFHPEFKVTVAEARKQQPAHFWDEWEKRKKGQVSDKRKIKGGAAGTAGTPPQPGAPAATAAPKKSLFGK